MIKYDSPEFWQAVWGEWVAVYESGLVYVYEQKPYLGGSIWRSPEGTTWTRCTCLDLDPASLPPWRESLRQRPYVWQQPDKDTPKGVKVWARAHPAAMWIRSHYAGVSVTGALLVWAAGQTEWTAGKDGWVYAAQIVLADPTDLDRVPPADWRPT
jgi:hypothetical protein